MTPLESFCQRWCKGCGSNQCRPGSKVVLGRGSIPCDILFVGEGPGEGENATGVPFIGPAGKLLDQIIIRSIGAENRSRVAEGKQPLTWGLTNLVCCIPRDEEDGGKANEPDDDQIGACKPRLQEFVGLCQPKLIVCVGRLAEDWLKPGYKWSIKFDRVIPLVRIDHPAYILRQNIAQQGYMAQRAAVTVANAVEDL